LKENTPVTMQQSVDRFVQMGYADKFSVAELIQRALVSIVGGIIRGVKTNGMRTIGSIKSDMHNEYINLLDEEVTTSDHLDYLRACENIRMLQGEKKIEFFNKLDKYVAKQITLDEVFENLKEL